MNLMGVRYQNPEKAILWILALVTLTIASLLGAVAHGIEMTEAVIRLLWLPLNLALGLTVAFFVDAAVLDGWGSRSAWRALPFLIGVSLLFFLVTVFVPKSFYLFLPFEAAGLLFALAVYIWLAICRRAAGAGWITAGILIMILAAAVQAGRNLAFTLIWPFDHRSVFHLLQIPGLMFITAGVRKTLNYEEEIRPSA